MTHPKVTQVTRARECSRVERCHTVPHHGSYTNGQHSHDALSLYLLLCPDPKPMVITTIHFHDYGERWCGDVPAPTKWAAPEIGKALHDLERRCLERVGFGGQRLCPEDERWLKAVDALDLYLWSHDQVAMGNQNARAIILNLEGHFESANLPEPVRTFLTNYTWFRTSDQLPT